MAPPALTPLLLALFDLRPPGLGVSYTIRNHTHMVLHVGFPGRPACDVRVEYVWPLGGFRLRDDVRTFSCPEAALEVLLTLRRRNGLTEHEEAMVRSRMRALRREAFPGTPVVEDPFSGRQTLPTAGSATSPPPPASR